MSFNEQGLIRPLQPADVNRIDEIYFLSHRNEYINESTHFLPQHLLDDEQLMALFEKSDIFVFDDGVIKGFAGGQAERISWLYVHPDHQGQKVGQRLLDFMLRRLNGIAAISVIQSNHLALGMYQRRGFKQIGEFEFDYQGVPVKALGLVAVGGQ